MALRKLKPVQLSAEQEKSFVKEVKDQKPMTAAPKSTDPENYPVFEVPVNQKVLIYVPNHTYLDENKIERLRMDTPLIHTVMDGKRFARFRCISGLNVEGVYSGTCPICEGESEPWDLAREIIKERCSKMGLNPDDTDNDTVKSIRREAFGARVIKGADKYYTFPIIVIETESADAKKPAVDENGTLKYKAMWYSISEAAYEKKWEKALESLEDEPTHPGGHFFILNYCYTPKSGEPNKRDSARELAVIPRRVSGFAEIAKQFDELTADWDERKAQTTVVDNLFYAESDLEEIATDVLQSTRDRLALYASLGSSEGNDDLGGFKLDKPVNAEGNAEAQIPMMTDLDE